jgi:hypothetical protein
MFPMLEVMFPMFEGYILHKRNWIIISLIFIGSLLLSPILLAYYSPPTGGSSTVEPNLQGDMEGHVQDNSCSYWVGELEKAVGIPTSEPLIGLDYSCHCGWIDNSHAYAAMRETKWLWSTLKREVVGKDKTRFGKWFETSSMFRQRMGNLSTTVRDTWRVKTGINEEQAKQIVMTMIMTTTRNFESMQGEFPEKIVSRHSSFKQADMPSNLIGFYAQINKHDLIDTHAICGVISIDEAFSIPQDKKNIRVNKGFEQVYEDSSICPEDSHWPEEFDIVPMAFSKLNPYLRKKGETQIIRTIGEDPLCNRLAKHEYAFYW